MAAPPAGTPVRVVTVPPERLERWLAGFAERHGEPACEVSADVVVLRAPDGAEAECAVPFPPLRESDEAYGGLVAHALVDRRVGVLLVRKGGFATGIFDGVKLVASKTGSRHVQGRSAAGGSSQQRFARRRDNQAEAAYAAAADTAARVLLPEAGSLDAVVLGGDRRALAAVIADVRLAPLRDLAVDHVLEVAEPRRAVLDETPAQFRGVRMRLNP